MEAIVPVVIVLALIAFLLGRARDSSLAKKIGEEVGGRQGSDDPVVLLEKLHQLREAGALKDAEYEAQKARILDK
ncbi:SHOCT domain-containing protein [Catellatospora chokoriensis]|uniref:SHOCT domain-containing protein n=1 Tax=Catellatospora chokoriensis TaxID=310353 RepID=UPI0017829437|nr:SHOCT domain-containing protein [Catellatospora chokoriensis]